MKLELKNVKVYESISRDSIAYSANLYMDGKKVAECSNNGYGGPDDIQCTDEIEKKLNEYVSKLPPLDFEGMVLEYTIDILIGELLDRYLLNKEIMKSVKKDQATKIIGQSLENDNKLISSNFVAPIENLLKSEVGRNVISKKIKDFKVKGYRILNTNIPKEMKK